MPFLSRMRIPDLAHWESLRSVRSLDGQSEVPIAFFAPFLYPVPAYGAQDCPYEITLHRLKERSSADAALADICRQVGEELAGHMPADMIEKPLQYVRTWVELRCFLELAGEAEQGLEESRRIIGKSTDAHALRAVFQLLLEEWALLGRARLRQSVAPLVQQKVIEMAQGSDTPADLRLLAVSLLRSLFLESFIDIVDTLADTAIGDEKLLARILLHIETLSTTNRESPSCVRFLQRVSKAGQHTFSSMSAEGDMSKGTLGLLIHVRKLLLAKEVDIRAETVTSNSSPVESAKILLHLLSENVVVRHELRPTLEQLNLGRDNLARCQRDVLEAYYRKWATVLLPLLLETILPHIQRLSNILLRASRRRFQFIRPETNYLVRVKADNRTLCIADDITTVVFCLENMRTGYASFIGSALGDSAARLWHALCGDRSAIEDAFQHPKVDSSGEPSGLCELARILAELHAYTAEEFVGTLQKEIKTALAYRDYEVAVSCSVDPACQLKHFLFLPDELVREVTAHVTSNLANHAFPAKAKLHVNKKVHIIVSTEIVANSESRLLLAIMNNGASLQAGDVQGNSGLSLNNALTIFMSKLPAPQSSTLSGYTVEQHFSCHLW